MVTFGVDIVIKFLIKPFGISNMKNVLEHMCHECIEIMSVWTILYSCFCVLCTLPLGCMINKRGMAATMCQDFRLRYLCEHRVPVDWFQ